MRPLLACLLLLLLPTSAPAELQVRQTFRGVVPVEGLDDAAGAMDAQMLVPRAWRPFRRDGKSGVTRASVTIGTCRLAITYRLRLHASTAPSVAEQLSLRLPNRAGVPLIDRGTRRDGAWRVVLQPEGAVQALHAAPSTDRRWTARVYREVFVDIRPVRGTCGHRARKAGGQAGDSLATAFTRAGPIP
jgi:hypothetical protein